MFVILIMHGKEYYQFNTTNEHIKNENDTTSKAKRGGPHAGGRCNTIEGQTTPPIPNKKRKRKERLLVLLLTCVISNRRFCNMHTAR